MYKSQKSKISLSIVKIMRKKKRIRKVSYVIVRWNRVAVVVEALRVSPNVVIFKASFFVDTFDEPFMLVTAVIRHKIQNDFYT